MLNFTAIIVLLADLLAEHSRAIEKSHINLCILVRKIASLKDITFPLIRKTGI
jgi:hypothetical protein